jgi:Tfp pilus assembly major pilin PilA
MKLVAETLPKQEGISLVSFIFVIAIIAVVAAIGMKVVPSVIEYGSIKKAIASAKNTGTSVREIQIAFDNQSTVGYIDSITGKDLEITKNSDGSFNVSAVYEKKIGLFGPVSLVIDYAASTGAAR